jgi:hypothetical protein
MKLERATGVWDRSGSLRLFVKRGADMAWSSRNSATLFSLEATFGGYSQQLGVRHALKRLETGTFRVLQEMEVCVPTGGVEYLVPAHRSDQWMAMWLEQNEWGYVQVDVEAMIQGPIQKSWETLINCPPAFSPDDRFIISCPLWRSGWWTDDTDDIDFWESPSPGGWHQVGSILVHDIQLDSVSEHKVLVDLPKGWMPERPEADEWDWFWGPEFVSRNEFKIWLPDDSIEILRLPLQTRIEIQRGLNTMRPWCT